VDSELDVDLKSQTPKEITLENLHRAAFRNGSLAQPLLAAPYQIGTEGTNRYRKLAGYVLSRWKSAESALIGVNIDHTLLLEYAVILSIYNLILINLIRRPTIHRFPMARLNRPTLRHSWVAMYAKEAVAKLPTLPLWAKERWPAMKRQWPYRLFSVYSLGKVVNFYF
jgi:hypothetical protein